MPATTPAHSGMTWLLELWQTDMRYFAPQNKKKNAE